MMKKKGYVAYCCRANVPLFLTPDWLDAVCGESNWDVVTYESGGRIIGALPYYIYRGAKTGLKYITQPPMTQFMGPWIIYPDGSSDSKKRELEKEVCSSLIEQLEQIPGIDFFEQNFSPAITNWQPFYWKGYRQTTRYTYRISPVPQEELLKNLFPDNRRLLKKAEGHDFTLDFNLSATEFFGIHSTFLTKRKDTISYSADLLQRIDRVIRERKCGEFVCVRNREGCVAAAALFVRDSRTAYMLISAFDRHQSQIGAAAYLVVEAIRRYTAQGLTFDFEGSMIESVEQAYRRYGSIQTPYFKISKILTRNPLKRFLFHLRNGDLQ